ncbi:MAG TPA: hypothetical protein VII01_16675 [Solirubrobacteraceae bacterium]
MTDHHDISDAHDICLLLRAHGEQRWLISEVLPVLREIEQPSSIPEDQLGAALAYLEVLWLGARRRATDTDAARAELDLLDGDRDRVLYDKARRYHAAVRRLRGAVGRRAIALTRAGTAADAADHQHARL